MKKKQQHLTIEEHSVSLVNKLLQVQVSGKFTAIIDAMFDVTPRRTDPALESIVITSDKCFMGRAVGDIGYNDFLGSYSDLKRNLKGVSDVAGLTIAEQALVLSRLHALGGPAETW